MYVVPLLLLACLQEYPGEELLLVYDHEYKYGENFYICLTEEAKELVLNVCRTLLTMHLRTYVHVSPRCAAAVVKIEHYM